MSADRASQAAVFPGHISNGRYPLGHFDALKIFDDVSIPSPQDTARQFYKWALDRARYVSQHNSTFASRVLEQNYFLRVGKPRNYRDLGEDERMRAAQIGRPVRDTPAQKAPKQQGASSIVSGFMAVAQSILSPRGFSRDAVPMPGKPGHRRRRYGPEGQLILE